MKKRGVISGGGLEGGVPGSSPRLRWRRRQLLS